MHTSGFSLLHKYLRGNLTAQYDISLGIPVLFTIFLKNLEIHFKILYQQWTNSDKMERKPFVNQILPDKLKFIPVFRES